MPGQWMRVWWPRRRPRQIHILPVNDLREHVEEPGCWCAPEVETLADGAALVTHNSMDGRELVERHGLM